MRVVLGVVYCVTIGSVLLCGLYGTYGGRPGPNLVNGRSCRGSRVCVGHAEDGWAEAMEDRESTLEESRGSTVWVTGPVTKDRGGLTSQTGVGSE